MESRFCTYKRVGYLRQKIANELGIEFTGVIYASPGVLKHIMRRHGKQLDRKTKASILDWMKKILDDNNGQDWKMDSKTPYPDRTDRNFASHSICYWNHKNKNQL